MDHDGIPDEILIERLEAQEDRLGVDLSNCVAYWKYPTCLEIFVEAVARQPARLRENMRIVYAAYDCDGRPMGQIAGLLPRDEFLELGFANCPMMLSINGDPARFAKLRMYPR